MIYQRCLAELDPYVLWLLEARALHQMGLIEASVFDLCDIRALLLIESIMEKRRA